MQLSSKAGPVVLKPFTNVHSPFWHSSFQHLTHTRSRSHWAPSRCRNHDIKSGSSSHSLLTGHGHRLQHPVSISPSPLCSRAEQQLCHPCSCSESAESWPRCSGAFRCQHPPSSLAKCQGRAPAPWAGSPGTGLPGAGSWEIPSWRGARAKEGVQAPLCSAVSDVKRSQAWEERLNQEKIFLFYTIMHSPLPAP